MPNDLATLRAELAKRDLKVSGTFVIGDLVSPAAWAALERQVLGAGELLAALGAKFLVLIDGTYTDERTGTPLRPMCLNAEGWQRLVAAVYKVDEIARTKFGLQLVFHPYAETCVEYED